MRRINYIRSIHKLGGVVVIEKLRPFLNHITIEVVKTPSEMSKLGIEYYPLNPKVGCDKPSISYKEAIGIYKELPSHYKIVLASRDTNPASPDYIAQFKSISGNYADDLKMLAEGGAQASEPEMILFYDSNIYKGPEALELLDHYFSELTFMITINLEGGVTNSSLVIYTYTNENLKELVLRTLGRNLDELSLKDFLFFKDLQEVESLYKR